MPYNIGYTNTVVIYYHSTVITKVMLLYNTEWWYDHGMAVNYCGKFFITLGLGSALCLVLIKAYRGQLWKGKTIKLAQGKNERKSNGIKLFIIIKLQKHFFCKKWQILGTCLIKDD
jgi:hypothetical protein